MEYLEFEKPIEELMEQYQTCSLVGEDAGVDVKLACSQIEDKIIEKKKEIKGLKIAIIGDIFHSRVARSNIIGLQKLGADVYIFGPSTLIPKDITLSGAKLCTSIHEACENADVIMGLRLQLERQKKCLFPSINEYSAFYGINSDIIDIADKNVLIMHPGPCNHGVEMPTSVYDCENSVINEQVTNGVAVRMAVLYLLNSRRNAL